MNYHNNCLNAFRNKKTKSTLELEIPFKKIRKLACFMNTCENGQPPEYETSENADSIEIKRTGW